MEWYIQSKEKLWVSTRVDGVDRHRKVGVGVCGVWRCGGWSGRTKNSR